MRLRLIQENLLPFLINVNFVEKNYLHKNNIIYIIKMEELFQNKVNSSLDCSCKKAIIAFPLVLNADVVFACTMDYIYKY